VASVLGITGAQAADHELTIQTHFSAESLKGKNVQSLVDDVERMSGGRVEIEMFYSASLVKATETFDAAVNGVLDGVMTGHAIPKPCSRLVWHSILHQYASQLSQPPHLGRQRFI